MQSMPTAEGEREKDVMMIDLKLVMTACNVSQTADGPRERYYNMGVTIILRFFNFKLMVLGP